MAGGGVGTGALAGGWIALIVIVSLLFVIIVVAVFCCFLRGMYCFRPRSFTRPLPIATALFAVLFGVFTESRKPDTSKYISNVSPNTYHAEPQSAGRYTNGYQPPEVITHSKYSADPAVPVYGHAKADAPDTPLSANGTFVSREETV